MKNTFIGTLFAVLFYCTTAQAQQFISINPDFGLKGQNISTTVTSSDFFFTWGSAPSIWGDFYMRQNNYTFLPLNVTVINDDELLVNWDIPFGAPSGNYDVVWEMGYWSGYYELVPGGFNVECVPPPAQITNSAPYAICPGSSLVLQANIGTGYSYQWYKSNIAISGATNSSYVATISGYYSVRVSDASGCPRFSEVITVGSYPAPVSTISPSTNQIICQGNNITLTANTNFSYQWYKNGNILNGITTKSISVSDSGSYTVRVSNSFGCTKMSNPVAVSYAAKPPAWVTASGPLTICAGSSVTLKTSTGTSYTYQWYKYGNPISGATSRTLVVTSAGSYKVQVTNASGCTKKSGAKIVSVVAAPPATITPQGPLTFCAGDSVVLNANTGAGFTYAWKKYGNIIAGATASSYTAKNAGPYKVIVTNSNGCSKVSQAKNVVITTCRQAQPDAFNSSLINIHPNPAQDVIYIEGDDITKVEIRNLEGKIVQVLEDSKNLTIDISTLPNGLYIAIMYSKDEVVSKRFVKQAAGSESSQ